jgi:hypothetical protein
MGRRRSYSVAQLKDPEKYTITFRPMTKNKRQELANLAMFSAAYNQLPLEYNLENILQVEDPHKVMQDLEIEAAKKADPAIGMFEMARSYAIKANEMEDEKEADALKIESKMLMERFAALYRERKQPAPLPEEARIPQVQQPAVNQAGNIMPGLLGRGGVGGEGTLEEGQ